MIGIVLVSHGAFAAGLLDAANMLYGAEHCFALDLNPADSPEDFGDRLEKVLKEADSGDGVFILADIMGGTPCNRAMLLVAKEIKEGKKRRLLAGVNVPMMISLLAYREAMEDFDELAASVISESSATMVDVNEIMKKEGLLND
ncbi:MAG: PTS sugar transporter subunit IIA [Defluviitaleaceae bacterium]|nr:PTS sugar transporter subunit IIA [Defluviitaleaceae bacterium]